MKIDGSLYLSFDSADAAVGAFAQVRRFLQERGCAEWYDNLIQYDKSIATYADYVGEEEDSFPIEEEIFFGLLEILGTVLATALPEGSFSGYTKSPSSYNERISYSADGRLLQWIGSRSPGKDPETVRYRIRDGRAIRT